VPEQTPILELGAVVARLPPGTRIHDVRIGSAAPPSEFDPDTIHVRPGDVVRFTVSATDTHAIAFDAAALTPDQGDFLSRTHQLRGPPLIAAGATWVVSLADAPPGAYPFLCMTHGARGVLRVVP
jgi:plastocyanin